MCGPSVVFHWAQKIANSTAAFHFLKMNLLRRSSVADLSFHVQCTESIFRDGENSSEWKEFFTEFH